MIETYETVLEWASRLRPPLRIGVLTSCTNQKGPLPTEAEKLYEGKQHVKLMRGVEAFRDTALAGKHQGTVDVWIASAKHGIIPGSRVIEPYNTSFRPVNAQGRGKLREQGEKLEMPEGARTFLSAPYDLRLVLLGNDYLDACHIELRAVTERLEQHGETVFFCAPDRGVKIAKMCLKHVHIVMLGPDEATRYGDGLICLKGRLAGALLARLGHDAAQPEPACATP